MQIIIQKVAASQLDRVIAVVGIAVASKLNLTIDAQRFSTRIGECGGDGGHDPIHAAFEAAVGFMVIP